jgi:hypothetical protein
VSTIPSLLISEQTRAIANEKGSCIRPTAFLMHPSLVNRIPKYSKFHSKKAIKSLCLLSQQPSLLIKAGGRVERALPGRAPSAHKGHE